MSRGAVRVLKSGDVSRLCRREHRKAEKRGYKPRTWATCRSEKGQETEGKKAQGPAPGRGPAGVTAADWQSGHKAATQTSPASRLPALISLPASLVSNQQPELDSESHHARVYAH